MAERPTRQEMIQALRDTAATIDGNDVALVRQAIALLRHDGYRVTNEDAAQIARWVANG